MMVEASAPATVAAMIATLISKRMVDPVVSRQVGEQPSWLEMVRSSLRLSIKLCLLEHTFTRGRRKPRQGA
jgi:hypothetical protein